MKPTACGMLAARQNPELQDAAIMNVARTVGM